MNLSNQVILFDGVNMPLVDSEDIVFDSSLSKSINERFTISKSGHITDDKGNLWMVWSLIELERWWNIFESAVGIPFGRKLFNSCCDEEEFQISDTGLFVKGLFRKKKNRNNLLNRWDYCGWGKIDINNNKIDTLLPSTIAAGFAVAAIESIHEKRFKSEWRQRSNTEVFLDLKLDEREIPISKKHTILPWSKIVDDVNSDNIRLELERRSIGWSIEGEPSVLLPVSLFSRLYYSTTGIDPALSNQETNCWIIDGLEERFCKPLIIASYSIYKLFIDSDKHVFANDKDSWLNLLNHYCTQWGWGGIDDLQLESDKEKISVKVSTSEVLPFILGQIIGIWERSYGKKPKIKIQFSENITSIDIESFLEYI